MGNSKRSTPDSARLLYLFCFELVSFHVNKTVSFISLTLLVTFGFFLSCNSSMHLKYIGACASCHAAWIKDTKVCAVEHFMLDTEINQTFYHCCKSLNFGPVQ